MLYGFLVQSNNSWFQQILPSEQVNQLGKLRWFKMVVVTEIWWVTNHRTEDVCSHCFLTANRPTNFYVGVASQYSEPTPLVQYLLANLTGSVINITQENCQKQREDEDDNESKHVRLLTIYNMGKKLNAKYTIKLTLMHVELILNSVIPPPPFLSPRSILTCGFKAARLPTAQSNRVSVCAPQCTAPKLCPQPLT